jgi:hypothetical protein
MKELDTVVLTRSFPDWGLVAGDVGAIVSEYDDHKAFEVEFVNSAGRTVALLTVDVADIRLRKADEILHVRELAS